MSEHDLIVVGRIGAAFGVKGWVHCHSYTSPPENLVSYRPWFIGREGQYRQIEELEVKRHKQGFVAQLDKINDRDLATEMRGQDIAVPRDALPATEEGEVYWRDLVGLEVVNEGKSLGSVVDLLETGANDVLVVRDEQGEEVLIPFAREYVLEVDVSAGFVRVAWQKDWG